MLESAGIVSLTTLIVKIYFEITLPTPAYTVQVKIFIHCIDGYSKFQDRDFGSMKFV